MSTDDLDRSERDLTDAEAALPKVIARLSRAAGGSTARMVSIAPECWAGDGQLDHDGSVEFYTVWYRRTRYEPDLHSEPHSAPGVEFYHLACLPEDPRDRVERHSLRSFFDAMWAMPDES